MISAEAVSSDEELGLGELIGLLGWPWKLAALLLLAAPALWFLPASGLLAADIRPWAGPAAMISACAAAALALGAGLGTLQSLLLATPATATGGDGHAVVEELRRILEAQRAQMAEATAAVGSAVTSGAQLSGLARAVEQQLKDTLGQPGGKTGEALLASLRQTISWADAELSAATARLAAVAERVEQSQAIPPRTLPAPKDELSARLENVLSRLESAVPATALSRIEYCAAQLESASPALALLPAAAERVSQSAQHVQKTTDNLERFENLLLALPSLSEGLRDGALGVNRAAVHMEGTVSALAARLQESAEEMGAAARRIDQAEASRLPGSWTASLDNLVARLEGALAGLQYLESDKHIMEDLVRDAGRISLARRNPEEQASGHHPSREEEFSAKLQKIVQALSDHVERVGRNEASLGDAARYLTETTDRFSAGTASLEMQAVRLQALISIASNREAFSAELAPVREAVMLLEQHLAATRRVEQTMEETQKDLQEVFSLKEKILMLVDSPKNTSEPCEADPKRT